MCKCTIKMRTPVQVICDAERSIHVRRDKRELCDLCETLVE